MMSSGHPQKRTKIETPADQLQQISASSNAPVNHLDILPPKILLQVFESIDDVTSTCLGLTCKKFHSIHQSKHQPVRLCKFTYKGKESFQLYQLLETWIPPTIVYRKRWPGIYVSKERYDEIVEAERAKKARDDEARRRVEEQDMINYRAFLLDEDYRKKKEDLLRFKTFAELQVLHDQNSDQELLGESDTESEVEHDESDTEEDPEYGLDFAHVPESGPENNSGVGSVNGSENEPEADVRVEHDNRPEENSDGAQQD